jgi:hypothetical protein
MNGLQGDAPIEQKRSIEALSNQLSAISLKPFDETMVKVI